MFLKQSTTATIMFGPFVDKTDGVTLETGAGIITSIDHATTGIFISKAGAAAAIRSQAVTASVLDAYGMFKVTLSTTDTNTVGTLDVLMAEAATFLPVHKSFMVLPANVYDSLMGADLLDVNAAQWLGTAILTPGTAGTPDVNAKLIGGTSQTGNDAGADLNAIVAKLPTNYIMGSSVVTDKDDDIDAILVDTAEIGVAGASLTAIPWNAAWDAEVESEVDDSIGGGTGTALTAIPWNTNWDAEVQSEATDALNAYDPPTKTEQDTAFTEIKGATWLAATDTLELIRDKETDIETDTQDLQTQIGTAGAGLTATVDAVWDELQSGHTTASTFGYFLDHRVSKSGGAISLVGGGESVWSKAEKDKILKQAEDALRLLDQKLDTQTFNIAFTALADLLEKVESSIKSGEISVKADLEKKITELITESEIQPLLKRINKELINLLEIENKGIQATQELDNKWSEEIKETLISVLTPLLPDETLERMVENEQSAIE